MSDVPAIPPATPVPPRRKPRSEMTGEEALALLARQAEEQRLRGIEFRRRQAAEGKSRFSTFLPTALHPEMRRHAAFLLRRHRPSVMQPAELVETSRAAAVEHAPADNHAASVADDRAAPAGDNREALSSAPAPAADDRAAPAGDDRPAPADNRLASVVIPGNAEAPVATRQAPVSVPTMPAPASPTGTPTGKPSASGPASGTVIRPQSVATPPLVAEKTDAEKTPAQVLAEKSAARKAAAAAAAEASAASLPGTLPPNPPGGRP